MRKKNSISMFLYEDKTTYCIYTPKQIFEKHVGLSLLLNFKNTRYVLNKDFNRFMTYKTTQCFSRSEVLE